MYVAVLLGLVAEFLVLVSGLSFSLSLSLSLLSVVPHLKLCLVCVHEQSVGLWFCFCPSQRVFSGLALSILPSNQDVVPWPMDKDCLLALPLLLALSC